MKIRKLLSLILWFHLLLTSALAQDSISVLQKEFTVAQLQEDFDVFRRNLENHQTGLYLYTPKEEMDQAFEASRSALNKPMNSVEFLRITTPLLKLIANGHTQLVGSAAYYEACRKDLKFFSFQLYRKEGKVYILRNLSMEEDIPSGAMLKTINGEDVNQLYLDIMETMTRDGYNTTLPQASLNNRFSRFYAIHDFLNVFFNVWLSKKARKLILEKKSFPA